MTNLVKSEGIYSPQNYVSAVTGVCYILKHGKYPCEEIKEILGYYHDYENLWDYPLTEIEHIVENEIPVVLVDVSHYEGDNYITEYRWFEVPEDFVEEN